MFEKFGEGDGDRAASRFRCRSQSKTTERCGAMQDPLQLRQNTNLPRFRSVVGGTTYGSATGGHTPPSAPTPSCSRQLGSPFYMDDDLQDMENIPVMGKSSMRGSGFEQISTVSSGMSPMRGSGFREDFDSFLGDSANLRVPRQKAVRELDFSDVNPGLRVSRQNPAGELDSENLTACSRVMRQKSAECRDGNAGDVALAPVTEYITPAKMQFGEAALHEIDEWQRHVDFKELSYVACMCRMRS